MASSQVSGDIRPGKDEDRKDKDPPRSRKNEDRKDKDPHGPMRLAANQAWASHLAVFPDYRRLMCISLISQQERLQQHESDLDEAGSGSPGVGEELRADIRTYFQDVLLLRQITASPGALESDISTNLAHFGLSGYDDAATYLLGRDDFIQVATSNDNAVAVIQRLLKNLAFGVVGRVKIWRAESLSQDKQENTKSPKPDEEKNGRPESDLSQQENNESVELGEWVETLTRSTLGVLVILAIMVPVVSLALLPNLTLRLVIIGVTSFIVVLCSAIWMRPDFPQMVLLAAAYATIGVTLISNPQIQSHSG